MTSKDGIVRLAHSEPRGIRRFKGAGLYNVLLIKEGKLALFQRLRTLFCDTDNTRPAFKVE